jgi:hypothetical protein
MRKSSYICAIAFAASLPSAVLASPDRDASPRFSWERVPVYAHVGKQSDDFTPEQLGFLAEHFPLISIEKRQAIRTRGSTEAGIAEAARGIKLRNPHAKVLFYLNTFLDIPGYEANQSFPKGGHLTDLAGKPVMVREQLGTFDLTRADVRGWWSDTAAKAVIDGPCDGIFADALLQVEHPQKRKLLGDAKYIAMNGGLVDMLKEARLKSGDGKLILINGLRGGEGKAFLPFADGAMIEHFGHFKASGKEAMAEDMAAMRDAALAGKIVCMKAWPGFSWLDKEMMGKTHAELAALARERLAFPLACFLAAAEANCYFCYTWGYGEEHGTFDWYPEFDKPLGEPQGAANRDGWIFRREFAHASVVVNLETKTSRIDWKKP